MAAFEYLTVNSLTSYPFRDGRAENAVQPITADTFLDIVFVLYSPNISRPYIKQIRAVNQDLSIDFHDVDGDAAIFTVNIPAADVVSHYKNKQKSFFGYRPTGYYPNAAVKLVFGDGIKKIAENGLTVDYTSEETELSPSAVQYSVPEVSTLAFESWLPDFDSTGFNPAVPQQVMTVHTFLREEDVGKHNGHNNVFNYLAPNTMYLDVLRGAGTGLYDPCGDVPPYDVITKINQISPDPSGNLFFKVSDCHALRLLTDDERSLALERIAAGGADYVHFNIPHYLYLWEGDTREDYAAHYPAPGRSVNILGTGVPAGEINCVNHGFVLENFCKPKCPHDNLNAFAEYLNRVKDGVSELFKIIENPVETAGKAKLSGTLLTATSFCQDLPTGWVNGTCGGGFKKYFHEGRRIRIRYNNITSYNVDIVEVLEASSGPNTQIRIANPLPELSPDDEYVFKISDLGILNKFNFEVLQQNAWSIVKNSPYIEFNYSTVEAFNGDGNYVTFITTITVVYNPDTEPLTFQINLTTAGSTALIPSSMKIRRESGEILYGVATDIIPCKSFAIFEAIFYIPCGNLQGGVTLSAVNATTAVELENSPKQVSVRSAGCVQINVGTTRSNAKENQFWGFNFAGTNLTTAQILSIGYAGLPAWITQASNNREGDLLPGQPTRLHLYGTPGATSSGILNQDYSITATITTGDGVFVTTLLLSYLAKPRITAPILDDIIEIRPPDTLNRTFTEGSPVVKITASNKPTSYNFRSVNPAPGFFPKGGKLIGRYDYSPTTTFPAEYTYRLVAKNEASLPDTEDDAALGVDIKLKVYDAGMAATDALQGVPYCFNIPNPQNASLSLLSTLPSWMTFNADPSAPNCNLNGTNNSNTSTTERFVIRYDYGNKFENLEYRFFYLAKPTFLTPASDGVVVELRPPDYMPGGESTQFSTLRPVLKIQTTNLPTRISASGLPQGLELVVPSGQTGVQRTALIVGKLAPEVVPNDYVITVTTQNAAGSTERSVILRLLNTAKTITALEGTNFCYQFSELAAASEYGITWDTLTITPPWLNAATPTTNTKVACHFYTAPGEKTYGDVSRDTPFVLHYESQASPGVEFNVAYVLKYVAKPRVLIPAAGETFTIASANLSDVEYTLTDPLFTLDTQNTPATYQITGLPAGLSLQDGKVVGTLTGTSGVVGEYLGTVTATNAAGQSKQTFKILIADRTVEQAYQDKFYCYKIKGMSGVSSYEYVGPKPNWLTFNPSPSATCPTGNFYGTPGVGEPQNLLGDAGFKFSIRGIRPSGAIEQDFRLDYYAKPVITYPIADTIFTISPPDYNATLFTGENPLFRVAATNSPNAFRVSGFATSTFRIDNLGNLIGTSGIAVNEGAPREVFLYASNQAGESVAVRVYFVVTGGVKTITFNSGNTIPCSPEARYQFNTQQDRPTSISLSGQPAWITFNPVMTSECNLTFGANLPALTSAQTIPLLLTRNYVGGKTTERFNLLITAPPIITNPTPAATAGTRVRYVIARPDFNNRIYTSTQPLLTVTAQNSPTSITSTGLPPGLRLVAAGADMGKVVSTTETTKVTQPGLYEVTVTASNSAGNSASVVFEIEVKDEDVEIYTRQGSPIQGEYCKLTTRDRATSYSLVSGALLSGLGFTGSTDASCNFYGVPAGSNFDISVVEIRSNYVGGFSNFNFKFIHLNYPTITKFTRGGLDILDDVLDVDPSDYLGVVFDEDTPLFVVETTGNPTSFYVEGFPPTSSLTIGCSGKIVGTIPESAAGVHTARVVAVNETGESLKKAITLNFSKTIPTITWPTPGEIIYGTPLTLADHLNAAASVSGTFTYDPPAGTVLNASDQARTLKATFTPLDLVNYASVVRNNTIRVSKATPQITWSTPEAISYYTPLSSTQLNASVNIPGTLIYSPSGGSRLNVGTQTLNAVFTPEQAINYTGAQRQVTLEVRKITVTSDHIYWNNPAPITYGTALSSSQLNARARLSTTDATSPGITSNSSSYIYNPDAGVVLAAGTHTLTVTFTSSDFINFSSTPVQKTITLEVLPQTPQISWNSPAVITYGTALSGTQLNASSSISGLTFTYNPTAGTVLAAGTHTLTVTVAGNPNYASSTLTRNLTVNKAASTLSFSSISSGSVGDTIELTTVKSGSSGVVSLRSQSPLIVAVEGSTAKLNRAGTATLTATLAEDSNYNGLSTSQAVTVARGPSTLAITSASSLKVGETISLAATKTGSTAQVTFQSGDSSRLAVRGTQGTGVRAGAVTLTANVAADANYSSTSTEQVFTVHKGDSTLTISSTNTGIEDNDVSLTTTRTGSGGSVTFTSSNFGVLSILNATTARLVAPGTAVLSASLAPDTDYLGATAQQSFTVVAKSPSTVSYTGATQGFVGDFITLNTTKTGSTSTVTFVSQSPAIATVTGTRTLSLLTPGTVTILATLAADNNFAEATTIFGITIQKKPSTLALTGLNSVKIGQVYRLTTTRSGSVGSVTYTSSNTNVATITSEGLVTLLSPGSVDFSATLAEDALFLGASTTKNLQVTKGDSTLTVTAPRNGTVGGTATLTFNKTGSTGAVTAVGSATSGITISGDQVTFSRGGTQNFTATLAEDSKYTGVQQTVSVSVAKVASAISLEFSTDGVVWGAAPTTSRPLNSTLFVRPVITGSTGGVTLTTTPTANLSDTTTCVNRTGVCRAEFNFTDTSLGTQTFKFAVAADQNYESAEVTGSIALASKPGSSIDIEFQTSLLPGVWQSASQLGAVPRGTELQARVVQTGSAGKITSQSNPTTNITKVYACSLRTSAWTSSTGEVCWIVYTLVDGNSQQVSFQVAEDAFYLGASVTKTITITETVPIGQKQPSTLALTGLNSVKIGQVYRLTTTRSGSVGSVTYTSSNTNVATITSEGLVTLLSPGSVDFSATLAEDALFAGTSTTKNLQVTKGDSTLTVTAPLTAKVGETGTLTFTKTGSTGAVTAVGSATSGITISGDQVTFSRGGTQKFTATLAEDSKYTGVQQTVSVSVAKTTSAISLEFSTDDVVWSATAPGNRPAGSTLFVRPVITGSTGAVSLTTSPTTNLTGTTNCVNRTGVCRAEFKFKDVTLGTQTFKFAVAADQNYEAAEVTGSVGLLPKQASSITIEFNEGGSLWSASTPALGWWQKTRVRARARVTGSSRELTLVSDPADHLYRTWTCGTSSLGGAEGQRPGTCQAEFYLANYGMQKITFKVAADDSYAEATATKTVPIRQVYEPGQA